MWTLLLPLTVLLMGIVAGAQMVLYHRFLTRLRQEHTAVWQELGSPAMTLSLATGWKSGWATHRFLRRKRYMNLHDPQLTRYAQQYRWLQVPYTLVLVLFLLSLLRSL